MSATVSSPLPTTPPLALAVRSSPLQAATGRWGCLAYGIDNGLQVPLRFAAPDEEYRSRAQAVVLCDASAESQVQIQGPDAASFVQWLSATDMAAVGTGECRRCLLVDEQGGVVGDPLLLRLAPDRYWLAEGQVGLLQWVKGVAVNTGLDLEITAPGLATLALEGVCSAAVMARILGHDAAPLGACEVREAVLEQWSLVLSPRRCGTLPAFSLRLARGDDPGGLWDRVMALGADFRIAPAAQSPVHRIEAGLPSLDLEMDAGSDPFELGLDALVDLDPHRPCVGGAALPALKARGLRRRLVGIGVGESRPVARTDRDWWSLHVDGEAVGDLRSTVYSPRLERTIGLGVVQLAHAEPGVRLQAQSPHGPLQCQVEALPFR